MLWFIEENRKFQAILVIFYLKTLENLQNFIRKNRSFAKSAIVRVKQAEGKRKRNKLAK